MIQNASYNFKAPSIEADANKKIEVIFPTAETQSVDAAEAPDLAVQRFATIVDLGELAAAATLTAVPDANVQIGAMLLIKAGCGATPYDLTLGDGFAGRVLLGEANIDKAQLFIFDGTDFVECTSLPLVPTELTSEVKVVAPVATMAATITKQQTIITIAAMGAAGTLNLTVDAAVKVGAILTVKAASDGTARDLTPGTKMVGPVVAGVISKTKSSSYIYDGTNFIAMGAAVQLD